MSLRRLALTSAVMAVIAVALVALAPRPADLIAVLSGPQAVADAAGPDAVVLAGCGLLAWVAWSWGALGLVLTAATALPGAAGATARLLLRVLLPAAARRAAAVALGVGLGLASPWLAAAAPPPGSPAPAAPDWPTTARPPADPVPDWPTGSAAGAHVVVRGDCLWEIAERRLAAETGRPPTAREIAGAVHAWWGANADVIGPDPDLLLPGQVLRPPAP
jgi:hypothetical protein